MEVVFHNKLEFTFDLRSEVTSTEYIEVGAYLSEMHLFISNIYLLDESYYEYLMEGKLVSSYVLPIGLTIGRHKHIFRRT